MAFKFVNLSNKNLTMQSKPENFKQYLFFII